MVKLRVFTGLLILCAKSAIAVELDQLQINSYINEPLDASITVLGVNEYELADIEFTLASQKDYLKLLGTNRPRNLDKIKLEVITDEEDRHQLRITSRRRVREPIFSFLLKVTDRQGSFIKTYTLLMDPRTEPSTEPAEEIKPIVLTEVTSFEEDADHPAPKPLENRKRIQVGNRGISIIAQNSDLHEKFSVYQIMRAFYLDNPGAFEKGNINKLTSGITLLVPTDALVGEVSRQQAVNFVYSVSRDHATPPVARPAVPIVPDQQNAQSKPKTPDQIAASLPAPEPQKKTGQDPDDLLNTLATKLNQQNREIVELRARLDRITTTKQSSKDGNNPSEWTAKAAMEAQQTMIAEQAEYRELVDQQFDQIDSDIAQLKNGMEILIENSPTPIELPAPVIELDEPLELVEENESPIPAAVEVGAFSYVSKLWIALLVIGAMLLFALREWTWQRRFREQFVDADGETGSQSTSGRLSDVGKLGTKHTLNDPLPEIDVEIKSRTPFEGMPMEVDFETQTQSTVKLNLQEVDFETQLESPAEKTELDVDIETEAQSPTDEPLPVPDAEVETGSSSKEEKAEPADANDSESESVSDEPTVQFEIDTEDRTLPDDKVPAAVTDPDGEPLMEELLLELDLDEDMEAESQASLNETNDNKESETSSEDEFPEIDLDAVMQTLPEELLPKIEFDAQPQKSSAEPLPELDIDPDIETPPEEPSAETESKSKKRAPRKKKGTRYKSTSPDGGEMVIRDLSESRENRKSATKSTEDPEQKSAAESVTEFKEECDTLIALEHYTEALQLVKASRANLVNDAWLDLKELEILAASDQTETFFEVYDQYKRRLKKELPEPWKEIQKMRRQQRRKQKKAASG